MRPILAFSVSLVLATFALPSFADGQRDKSNSQFKLRQGDVAGGAGETARARARAGDCEGALDYFDRAIDVTTDPTLQRDRGFCHDKLNHPFPAIQDFRAYLSARPDSPDSDQIRERLGQLESANGVPPENTKGDPEKVRDTPAQRAAIEDLITDERLADAAETSPLRNAPGFELGAYGGFRRFVGSGTTDDFGYQVGAALRISTGKYFTILGEVGYVGYGSTGTSSGVSGPGFFLGGELKLPITKNSSDQFLFGLGPGYERYSASGSAATSNVIMALARAGYRHVFGANFGMELTVQGGYAHFIFSDVPLNINVPDADRGIVGAQLALVLGF